MRQILATIFWTAAAAAAPRVPTIDDLLTLKSVSNPRISPDGKRVAYVVNETDFKKDAYGNHVWVADIATGASFQLTRGEKSCGNPKWSPDGQWIAFTSDRAGNKNQIFAISTAGGEAVQLTKSESAVGNYSWSPDSKRILFIAADPETQAMKDRKDHLGDWFVVRREYSHHHIWTIDVADALEEPAAGTQRTRGKDFNVGYASWSPDGSRIAFSATRNPDLIHSDTSDIYVVTLADNPVKKIVSLPGADSGPEWSPDGTQVIFRSLMGKADSTGYNSRLAVVPAGGGAPRSLTDSFDESPFLVEWNRDGVYFEAFQKTASHLFRLDPATLRIARVSAPDSLIAFSVSFSADGRRVAFTGPSPTALGEVYAANVRDFAPRAVTRMTDQVKDLILGKREVISWKSKDGTVIEGIVIKPADFDPSKKYPLLCIIHGGPTGIDLPSMADTRYYPSDVWAGRGALVLKVNYRGSIGYGERFRRLNIRNLGVGDAWDVLSGVDHLVAKGWVDPAKVASMGWSQGGYISAFLTTTSDRFAAISVGAGISNWSTYYYNTDITPFTLRYLGDDPADDPEIYRKTSPMSYIKTARTPTLVQHGENDRRVPIPNAYELRQGLEDRGVKVEMIVYKGFGHGITKPKAMRAVMQHNMAWFNHYLWGDPMPDFTAPEVPKKKESAKKPAGETEP